MDKVGVFNLALGRVGISVFVQSPDEKTNQAIVCNRFYDDTLDRVLSEFPWGFATATIPLADIGNPPETWAYRYRYPNDCVKVQEVLNFWLKSTKYAVMADGGDKAIVTNETAIITYTARVTNPNQWSPKFVNAFAWALAAEIAGPLAAKPEYTKAAGDAYILALTQAGAQDLNERNEGEIPVSSFEEARR